MITGVALTIAGCTPAKENSAQTQSQNAPAKQSPQQKETPPRVYKAIPPPVKVSTYYHPIGYSGKGKVMSLTFDDGPGEYTPQVLDILKREKIKATFCVVGVNVKKHPDLVKRIFDEGHELCNHSYAHSRSLLTKGSSATLAKDMSKTNEEIKKIIGVAPSYYRAPEGIFGGNVPKALKSEKMRPLAWMIDSLDWTQPGVKTIIKSTTRNFGPGKIILMHDGGGDRSQTVKALSEVIKRAKAKKYKFITPFPEEAPAKKKDE